MSIKFDFTRKRSWLVYCLVFLLSLFKIGNAIQCYQCSSDQDHKGEDNCGAYDSFNTDRNAMVDCLGEEAVTPGTFCYKSIQQSPRGFIWDGRWRTVTRRCAQMSERGINWGCDWGYKENGVYWEECYCAEDGCNSALSYSSFSTKHLFCILLLAALVLFKTV